jgi:membrane protease YdiL (CAAX protease family)
MNDNSTVHPFNPLEFWLVIGLAFGLPIVTSILALFAGAPTAESLGPLGHLLKSELIVTVILIAVLRRGGWRLRDFNLLPSWRTTLLGAVLAITVISALWLLANLAQPFLGSAIGNALRLPTTSEIEGASLLLMLGVSIIDPLYEEMLVCGYVIEALRGRYGKLFAINVSVALRVAYHAHQGPFALLQFAALGLLFAYCYTRWRNLWPMAVAHGLVDFVGIAGDR